MRRQKKADPMPLLSMSGLCFSLLVLVVGLMTLNPIVLVVAGFFTYKTAKSVWRWVVA